MRRADFRGVIGAALTGETLVDLDSDRGRSTAAFLAQPFFTAEPFSGRAGEYVGVRETLDGIERVLSG